MLDRRRRGNGPHFGSRHRKFPIRLNPSQFDVYGFETCDIMFRHRVTSRCEPFSLVGESAHSQHRPIPDD